MDDWFGTSWSSSFKLPVDNIDEIFNGSYGLAKFVSNICFDWSRLRLLHIQVHLYIYTGYDQDYYSL